MTDEENRLHNLERTVAELSHTVVKLQQELLRASKWTNEDPQRLVEGIQVFLGKAGEVKGRKAQRRRPR